MKKYEILLFDLDGTLIDFSVDQKFAFKYALEKIGYEYTDDILEQYKEINRIVWSKLEKGEIETVADLFEERCKMFFEIYNINESTGKFNNLLDESYMPINLKEKLDNKLAYPIYSSFHVAFKINKNETFRPLQCVRIFVRIRFFPNRLKPHK